MIHLSQFRGLCSLFFLVTLCAITATLMAKPTVPPGGLEQFVVTCTHPDKDCVTIPSCPGRKNQAGVYGSDCSYCERQWPQSECAGFEIGTCTQNDYRQGAPSCGVRWVSGAIGSNGHCVGAVASGICYRVTCTQAAPETP